MRVITQKHIDSARLLIDRYELLRRLPKGGVVAECGVDEGNFSESILTLNAPRKLYLIDPWNTARYGNDKYNSVKERFADEIRSGRVEIIRDDDLKVLKSMKPNTLDWAYIDSSHIFSHTMNELELCRIRVRRGGIVAGHDYTMGNVRTGCRYGVVKAVRMFCAKYDWEYVYLTHEEHLFSSFAIREAV